MVEVTLEFLQCTIFVACFVHPPLTGPPTLSLHASPTAPVYIQDLNGWHSDLIEAAMTIYNYVSGLLPYLVHAWLMKAQRLYICIHTHVQVWFVW